MIQFVRLVILAVLLSGSSAYAQLSLSSNSTIQIGNVKVYCQYRTIPYLEADIIINDEDRGLPGILYLGTIDDNKTRGFFLGESGWTPYNGGNIPPYVIMRGGLQKTTIVLNLTSLPLSSEHNIYMGYGALTAASERIVQAGIAGVEKVKQKFPDKKIHAVDPDMHRLALVQENMTKNTKYQFVLKSANFPQCEATS